MAAYDRYIELNINFSAGFVYRIQDSGLYSQINMVQNAVAYSLMNRKRLMVDTRNFLGHWADDFGVSLPGHRDAVGWLWDFVPKRYEWLKYRKITMLLRWAENFDEHQRIVNIPELGFQGDVFTFYRFLAKMLCPHVKPKPVFAGDYAACHIRRGDKLIREGQYHDVAPYLNLIRHLAPDVKKIFVMTDDYSVIEDMRAQAPDFDIASMCKPDQRGYVHEKFIS